jgi:hypothetical protein
MNPNWDLSAVASISVYFVTFKLSNRVYILSRLNDQQTAPKQGVGPFGPQQMV